MEFWRKKNTDTRVVFPIQKNDGTFITTAAGLDSEFALYGAHGAGAPSFGDCTHEATEIGTTGLYYLDVSAAELNDDYGSVIQIKSSSAGAITQVLLFHTDVATVADAIWDEATAGHSTTGTTGNALTNAGASGTPLDAAGVRAAVGMASADLDTQLVALPAVNADTGLALKLLRNKDVTDPATGIRTIYDDNSTDVLYTANIYEDVAGTMPFDGSGANRRDRMT